MLQLIYELRKNCCGLTGRVDGTDEGSIRGPRGPKNRAGKSVTSVLAYFALKGTQSQTCSPRQHCLPLKKTQISLKPSELLMIRSCRPRPRPTCASSFPTTPPCSSRPRLFLFLTSPPHILTHSSLRIFPQLRSRDNASSTEKKAGQVSPTDPTSAHLRHHLS